MMSTSDDQQGQAGDSPRSPLRRYKYYDLIMAVFVTVLLCSNLIGPAKIWTFYGLSFGAGILFFPISYLFGDVLTEVYGYARARKVVWAGFGGAGLCLDNVYRRIGLARSSRVAASGSPRNCVRRDPPRHPGVDLCLLGR